jgi:DGQHR domain-containing protein
MSLNTISLTTPVPVVQGRFGDRIATYTTQLTPLDVRRILGHDPRSKYWKILPERTRTIYQQVQRTTSGERGSAVANYIKRSVYEGIVGAFPAISIGISKAVKFTPLEEGGAIGMMFLADDADTMVLDGLGRLTACFDIADDVPDGVNLVKRLALPVTFYAPVAGTDDFTQGDFGQLFADFNFRVNPVPARIAIALEKNDPWVQLTDDVADQPFLKEHGGMERKAASLGKKSTAIVVQTVLLRTVRGACEGRDFQEKNIATVPDPNLTLETHERELGFITEFFSEIAARMGNDRWEDHESLHLSAPGWQALGVVCHDVNHRGLNLTAAQKSRVYDVIAGIDWSRTNPEWVVEAQLGTADDDGSLIIRGAGRNNTQHIIDFVRRKTGLQMKLDAQRPAAVGGEAVNGQTVIA